MENPVVLITGALTGIGRAAAVAFARKGAKVVVAGRRDEARQGARRGIARRRLGSPSSSTPRFAKRKTSATWSTRPCAIWASPMLP